MAQVPTRIEYLLSRIAQIKDPATLRQLSPMIAALDPSYMTLPETTNRLCYTSPLGKPAALASGTDFDITAFNYSFLEESDLVRFRPDDPTLMVNVHLTITSISGAVTLQLVVQLPPQLDLVGDVSSISLVANGTDNVTNLFGSVSYNPLTKAITYAFDTSISDYLNLPLELQFNVTPSAVTPLTQSGAQITALLFENGTPILTAFPLTLFPFYPELNLNVAAQDKNLSPPTQLLVLADDSDFYYAVASVTFPQTPPMGVIPISILLHSGDVQSISDVQVFVDGQDVTSQGTVDFTFGFLPTFTFTNPVDLTGRTLTMRVRSRLFSSDSEPMDTLIFAELNMSGYFYTSASFAMVFTTAGPQSPPFMEKRFRSVDCNCCSVFFQMPNINEVVFSEMVVGFPSGDWNFLLNDVIPLGFEFMKDADGIPFVQIVDQNGKLVTDLFEDLEITSDDFFIRTINIMATVPEALQGKVVYFRIPIRRDPAASVVKVASENFAQLFLGKSDAIESASYIYPPCVCIPVEQCKPCPSMVCKPITCAPICQSFNRCGCARSRRGVSNDSGRALPPVITCRPEIAQPTGIQWF